MSFEQRGLGGKRGCSPHGNIPALISNKADDKMVALLRGRQLYGLWGDACRGTEISPLPSLISCTPLTSLEGLERMVDVCFCVWMVIHEAEGGKNTLLNRLERSEGWSVRGAVMYRPWIDKLYVFRQAAVRLCMHA